MKEAKTHDCGQHKALHDRPLEGVAHLPATLFLQYERARGWIAGVTCPRCFQIHVVRYVRTGGPQRRVVSPLRKLQGYRIAARRAGRSANLRYTSVGNLPQQEAK